LRFRDLTPNFRPLLIAIGWAIVAAIVWLSVTPDPPQVDFEASDKAGHLLAYGGLMFWFCLLYARRSTRLAYACGFVAMGIALEFVQRALGYRSFELLDMVADALGVLLGFTVALLLARFVK
jgi:VanZ family protein